MTLIEDLRAAIGDAAVITDPAQFAPMLTDNRRRWHGQAACCALPASTDEVSRLMAVCTKHKALVLRKGATPVTPQPPPQWLLMPMSAARCLSIPPA